MIKPGSNLELYQVVTPTGLPIKIWHSFRFAAAHYLAVSEPRARGMIPQMPATVLARSGMGNWNIVWSGQARWGSCCRTVLNSHCLVAPCRCCSIPNIPQYFPGSCWGTCHRQASRWRYRRPVTAWVTPVLIQRTGPFASLVFETSGGPLLGDPRGWALITSLCSLWGKGLAYSRLNDPVLSGRISPNWRLIHVPRYPITTCQWRLCQSTRSSRWTRCGEPYSPMCGSNIHILPIPYCCPPLRCWQNTHQPSPPGAVFCGGWPKMVALTGV